MPWHDQLAHPTANSNARQIVNRRVELRAPTPRTPPAWGRKPPATLLGLLADISRSGLGVNGDVVRGGEAFGLFQRYDEDAFIVG